MRRKSGRVGKGSAMARSALAFYVRYLFYMDLAFLGYCQAPRFLSGNQTKQHVFIEGMPSNGMSFFFKRTYCASADKSFYFTDRPALWPPQSSIKACLRHLLPSPA
jgi:hypothetical protein